MDTGKIVIYNPKPNQKKTRLIFLVLLIACYSCGNNKSVSDAQKEKIMGEVKEIVHGVFKGAEEANFDMVVETWYDSPDFVYMCNGKTYSYKETMDEMKQFLNVLLNQKCTIVDEKYAVLDNSTVLGTINTNWLMNYKDGHFVLQDPWAVQFTFKKIENRWKVIYHVESGIEKNVINSESLKGLNQSELLKKFVGNWEIPVGKDTSLFLVIKNYKGEYGLNVSDKLSTKGKTLVEGTGFWAYDAAINKINLSLLRSNGDVTQNLGAFTSPNTYEYVNVNNSPSYKGVSKCTLEFISPDEIKGKYLVGNEAVILTWKRLKK
jgi:hypothetical protein